MKSIIQPIGADPAVEAELDRLPTTPIANLRKRYRELFRAEPPTAFGPDLLRRSIAHTIQEKAYGGLPPTTRRLLDQMVKAASTRPNGRLELPRRIKPGSELVRTWNRKTYRVTVMADGFAYGGKTFASLSKIASSELLVQQIKKVAYSFERLRIAIADIDHAIAIAL